MSSRIGPYSAQVPASVLLHPIQAVCSHSMLDWLVKVHRYTYSTYDHPSGQAWCMVRLSWLVVHESMIECGNAGVCTMCTCLASQSSVSQILQCRCTVSQGAYSSQPGYEFAIKADQTMPDPGARRVHCWARVTKQCQTKRAVVYRRIPALHPNR